MITFAPKTALVSAGAHVSRLQIGTWRSGDARPAHTPFRPRREHSVSRVAAPALSADTTIGTAAVFGAFGGVLHTVAALDHLAVLTPVALRRRPATASVVGILWGVGHGLGQALIGAGLLIAAAQFRGLQGALSRWAGIALGVNLLMIGAHGLFEAYSADANEVESSLVGGRTESVPKRPREAPILVKRMMLTGLLCGLQVDSLIPLLPALALGSRAAGVAFVAASGAGSIVSMGAYAAVMSAVSRALHAKVPDLEKYLVVGAASLAVLAGLAIIATNLGLSIPWIV